MHLIGVAASRIDGNQWWPNALMIATIDCWVCVCVCVCAAHRNRNRRWEGPGIAKGASACRFKIPLRFQSLGCDAAQRFWFNLPNDVFICVSIVARIASDRISYMPSTLIRHSAIAFNCIEIAIDWQTILITHNCHFFFSNGKLMRSSMANLRLIFTSWMRRERWWWWRRQNANQSIKLKMMGSRFRLFDIKLISRPKMVAVPPSCQPASTLSRLETGLPARQPIAILNVASVRNVEKWKLVVGHYIKRGCMAWGPVSPQQRPRHESNHHKTS